MNLARHRKLIGWAVSAKLSPLVYGATFVLVAIPLLPKAEHGRYAVVFYIFTLITLFNKFLVLHPMIRFGAEPGRFSDSVRSGFHLGLIFYLIAGVMVWTLAPQLAGMFRGAAAADIRFVPWLLAAIFLREFGFCVQQILYNTRRIFILETIYFLGSALGFILLALRGELNTAQAALNVHLAAAAASSFMAVFFGFGEARLFRLPKIEECRNLLRYGVYTVGIGFSSAVANGLDVLLIGTIYTTSEVATYNGAKAVYRIVAALTQAVALVVMPYAARLKSGRRSNDFRVLYEKVIGYSLALLIVVVAAGWLSADAFFGGFFGGRYAGSSSIFRVMILAAPFDGLYTIAGNMLYGAGAAASVALISLAALLSWLAVATPGVYLWGGIGVALGFVAAMVIAGIMMHLKAARTLQTDFRRILSRLRVNFTALTRLLKHGGRR